MFFCTTADVCCVADIVGLCLELLLELSSYWASAFSLPTPWKPFRPPAPSLSQCLKIWLAWVNKNQSQYAVHCNQDS
jgi:hypothetical protein